MKKLQNALDKGSTLIAAVMCAAMMIILFANVVLRHSASLGAVKYALSVLELLAASQGQWRQTVRTLALSDELT